MCPLAQGRQEAARQLKRTTNHPALKHGNALPLAVSLLRPPTAGEALRAPAAMGQNVLALRPRLPQAVPSQ